MKTRAALTGTIVLSLWGCGRDPDYPVPEQRPIFTGFKVRAGRIVNMSDPDAPARFVRDIAGGPADAWRWTGQKPALKIKIRAVENLKYTIDYTVAEVTFKDTGPVTIKFTVNDHVLGQERITEQGNKHFEKPIPPEWLEVGQDAILGAEIDKMWTSKLDGARFGFILSRIGVAEVKTE